MPGIVPRLLAVHFEALGGRWVTVLRWIWQNVAVSTG